MSGGQTGSYQSALIVGAGALVLLALVGYLIPKK